MTLRIATIVLLSQLLSVWPASLASAQTELPAPGDRESSGSPVSRQQISYALGLNIGKDLRADEVDIDLKSMADGLMDGFEGNEPKWTEEQCMAALRQFQQQMQRQVRAQRKQSAVKNKQQAAAFLEQNKQREGVTETASGLQYEVLESGNGASPTSDDTVRAHYRGTLLDGTEFDSSYQRGEPIDFPVSGVIDGWTEALQKMRVGDKWKLFVPPNLAYGADPPSPSIQPNSLLIFEVQLVDIVR